MDKKILPWTTLIFHVMHLFSIFHHENPMPKVRSKVKVTQNKHNIVDSHPFFFKSNRPSNPEIQLFQNLNLNIQKINVKAIGQHLRSHSGSIIPLIHILFIPCQEALPVMRYGYFKMWPWKSKVEVMVEVKFHGHIMGPTSHRFFCLFLWYNY